MSPEELLLRCLDSRLAAIDVLLERCPAVDATAGASVFGEAAGVVDQVAIELAAAESVVRSIEMLIGVSEKAIAITAAAKIALEVARVAISLTRAQLDELAV